MALTTAYISAVESTAFIISIDSASQSMPSISQACRMGGGGGIIFSIDSAEHADHLTGLGKRKV
jgi:hypothetical protein